MIVPTVRRLPTTRDALYAFEIDGKVTAAGMEAMADQMNAAFDTHDRVDMLLFFRDFDGSEIGAGFDWSSIRSRLRSLAKVDKYVAVGTPEEAAMMIEVLGKLVPVETKAFPLSELDAAWDFLGARPV